MKNWKAVRAAFDSGGVSGVLSALPADFHTTKIFNLVSGLGAKKILRGDLEDELSSVLKDSEGLKAAALLKVAGDLSRTDLVELARGLSDIEARAAKKEAATTDDGQESDAPVDDTVGAFAKPSHAGGDGSAKGGGKGRDKTKDPAPDPDPETETSPEPAPAPEPEPTPAPEPEPEPTPAPEPTDDPAASEFNIDVEFYGTWAEQHKQELYQVIGQVESIVTGDLPDVGGIDDFKLWAGVGSIDGSGGALAIGNTVYLRSDSKLPYEGFFKIDEADAAKAYSDGLLEDVILHEIFHAMGFGTIWDELGLTEEIGGTTRFVGQNAIDAYNSSYSNLAESDPYSHLGVPMSPDDAHWDHATFTRDIMTTSLYPSGNLLSEMDIAALEDMGYQTTYADEFILA